MEGGGQGPELPRAGQDSKSELTSGLWAARYPSCDEETPVLVLVRKPFNLSVPQACKT